MTAATPENIAKKVFDTHIMMLRNVKLFSNLQGNFWTGLMLSNKGGTVVLKFARRLKAGFGPVGMPDRIGWRQLKITQDMVGATIAQFCAAEIKRFDGKGKISVEQVDMIDFINNQGGFAVIINNIDDAKQFFGEME